MKHVAYIRRLELRVCHGHSYKNLSAIAKLISGAQWSGPAFFGLESVENIYTVAQQPTPKPAMVFTCIGPLVLSILKI